MNVFDKCKNILENKKFRNSIVAAIFMVATLIANAISSMLEMAFSVFQNISVERHWWNYIEFHPVKYFLVYFVIYGVVVAFFVMFWINFKKSYESLEDDQKGSARFTTLEELKEQYKAIPSVAPNNEIYPGLSGTITSRFQDTILIDTGPRHNVIVGMNRSGKGESLVVPNIDVYSRSEEKPSLIINDMKGELIAASKETLEKRGYEVYVFNLMDSKRSVGYNILEHIKKAYKEERYADAEELCKTLSYPLYHNADAKDPIWEETAMALVNAIILSLCHEFIETHPEYITMYSVANMLVELGSKQDEEGTYLLDKYFASLPIGNRAKIQYATVQFAKGQMKASIFASAMAKLQKFTSEDIANLMANTTIDIEKIRCGNKPQAIFLLLPDYTETNYVIASTFIQQLYYVMAKNADQMREKTDLRRVRFVLDEFGGMPSLSNINSIVSVGAGRGLLFDFYIQDNAQIRAKYKEFHAKVVKGQAGNQIFILSNDDETRKNFSALLGKKTITVKSRSGGWLSLHKQFTESVDSRDLMTADELGRLKEGEIIIVRSTMRRDLKGNRIVPYPIHNDNETRMVYRYEYLSEQFDTSKSWSSLDLPTVEQIDLQKYSEKFIQKILNVIPKDDEEEQKEETEDKKADNKKGVQNKVTPPLNEGLPSQELGDLEDEGVGIKEENNDITKQYPGYYNDVESDIALMEEALPGKVEEAKLIYDAYKETEVVAFHNIVANFYLEDIDEFDSLETVDELLAYFNRPDRQDIKEKAIENGLLES